MKVKLDIHSQARTAKDYDNDKSDWNQEIFEQDLKAAKERVKNRKHNQYKWQSICNI